MFPRSGVTWLEVLVVVSVIALLLALGLPALQNARESSRRVVCQNHLKELGIAAHQYESVHRHFPGMFYHFRSLLPYLDQEPLYKHLVGLERPGRYRYAGSVPVLVCPSDSHANVARNPTSYRLNLGTTLDSKRFDGMLEGREYGAKPSGPLTTQRSVTVQDVRDGLSNTVFYGERLVQPKSPRTATLESITAQANRHSLRYVWRPAKTYFQWSFGGPLAKDCQQETNRITALIPNAHIDFAFTAHPAHYTHHSPPNTFGCFMEGVDVDGLAMGVSGGLGTMTMPLTSSHAGGVHVVLADGGTRFVSEKIDENVWAALGTRAGGEPIDAF